MQMCKTEWYLPVEIIDKALFSTKSIVIFLISSMKIYMSTHGTANEYPQDMFLWRNKKNTYLIHPLAGDMLYGCNKQRAFVIYVGNESPNKKPIQVVQSGLSFYTHKIT